MEETQVSHVYKVNEIKHMLKKDLIDMVVAAYSEIAALRAELEVYRLAEVEPEDKL